MNFHHHWFSQAWLWGACLPFLAVLGWTAPAFWRSFQKHQAHLLIAWLMMVGVWGLQAPIGAGQLSGMAFHLLGINLAVLMVGSRSAFWLGSVVLAMYLVARDGWQAIGVIPLNALVLLTPICLLNAGLRRLSKRFMPANIFVFIFINAFGAGALGLVSTGIVVSWVLQGAHAFTAQVLWQSAFPVFILIAWGEAFFSGMFTAILIAFSSQWLLTFDEPFYFSKVDRSKG